MLEIGGGQGYASELVSTYCGIEPNPIAVTDGRRLYPQHTFHQAHFEDVPLRLIRGRYDLVLACAVVEHCQHYKAFILRAMMLKPRFILVSFFRGLNRDADMIRRIVSNDTEWSRAGGVYYDNSYAKGPLERWLAELPIWWNIHHAGTDGILEIDCESTNRPRRNGD